MFNIRLKELRSKSGDTQASLADKLGVSNRTIAAYEQGINEPSIDTLIKLSEYFNVTVDYLIGNSNSSDPINIENIDNQIKQVLKGLSSTENSILPNLSCIFQIIGMKKYNSISADTVKTLDSIIFSIKTVLRRYQEYHVVAVQNSEKLNGDVNGSEQFMQLASHFNITDFQEALYFAQQGFYPRAFQESTNISRSSMDWIENLYQQICSLNALYNNFSDKYKDGIYNYNPPQNNSNKSTP